MQHPRLISFFMFLVIVMVSCVPAEETQEPTLDEIVYHGTEVASIWSFGLAGEPDSLLPFLTSHHPVERYIALQMFSNQRMEIPLLAIAKMLDDPLLPIREKAAFVLGQSGSSKAAELLVNAFDQNDSLGQLDLYNSLVLEAVGKTGNAKHALQIAQVKTYSPKDSLLTLGQARALFQFAIRGIMSPESTDKMISFLTTPTYAPTVRYVAAEYLKRYHDGDLDSFQYALKRTIEKTKDPELLERLAYTLPALKIDNKALLQKFAQHPQASVRLAYVRAMSQKRGRISESEVKEFFTDSDVDVAVAATEYFLKYGQEDQAVVYREWAQEEGLHPRVRYGLFGAALKHLPFYYQLTKTTLMNELRQEYEAQKNPYLKAALLEAFAYDPSSIPFLIEIYRSRESSIFVKTTAVRSISKALKDDRFRLILGGRAASIKRSVFDFIQDVFSGGHSGAICEASLILKEEASAAQKYYPNLEFLQETYDRLSFPADAEAGLFLKEAATALEETLEIGPEEKNWALPDTALLSGITDSTEVEVKTTKGTFTLALLPKDAPFTVSSFLKSVAEGYYTSKAWHRVVPNFVAQTGCPQGDGYGSGDFTIPTESSEQAHYSEAGWVGVASAGTDTESSQWFITYGPTPHLDGRYTIFGKVQKGMEVVKKLQVGDEIVSITIKKKL